MPVSVYPTGTTIYDPEKCWNGYTSFSAGGPAQIIDMNGNVVNSWQGLSGQAKMFPGGYVTAMTKDGADGLWGQITQRS